MSESERDLCELVCAIRRNRCDGGVYSQAACQSIDP